MFDFLKRKTTAKPYLSLPKLSHSIPELSHLPINWNKDWFHFVNIHLDDKLYVGYLWATNNWVEIHCFDYVSIETVYKVTGDECNLGVTTEVSGQDVTIYRSVQMLWANKGFVFGNRILSALTPRVKVKYSYLGDSFEFYSKEDGFRDSVYIQLSNDDRALEKKSSE